MNLTFTNKEAIKTALAMVVAYGVALHLDWDRPYWAGFAVAFCSLNTIGQSANKSLHRLVGTAVATVVALVLIALFAQERWLFVFWISAWVALCTYMMMGKRYNYAWQVAGFVVAIICADAPAIPGGAFDIAVLRLQQTGLGVIVYGVVSVLLWPNDSRPALAACVATILSIQQQLAHKSFASQADAANQTATKELRDQEVAQLTQLDALLAGAEVDSEEVRVSATAWRSFQSATVALGLGLVHWRDTMQQLQGVALQTSLPQLAEVQKVLEHRLQVVAGLLDVSLPEPDSRMAADTEEPQQEDGQDQGGGFSHFKRATISVAAQQLRELDRVSALMLESAQAIAGAVPVPAQPAVQLQAPAPRTLLPVLDLERCTAAFKTVIAVWLAFLMIFYIEALPGAYGVMMMAVALGIPVSTMPQVPVRTLMRPSAIAIVAAGVLYMLLMPQLSTFLGLGIMLFVCTFLICNYLASPKDLLSKFISLAMFVVVIGVSNQQSYSFISVATTLLMVQLVLLLLFCVSYVPFTPRPERWMLRFFKRYLKSARYLVAKGRAPGHRWAQRYRYAFHIAELAGIPDKVAGWVAHADADLLGADSVQQLPQMVGVMKRMSYRMQDLLIAEGLPQASAVRSVLRPDMLEWRDGVLSALEQLADDPAHVRESGAIRLEDILRRIEDRMQEIVSGETGAELSSQELENCYHLLAAYRGLSEVVLDLALPVARIDWAPWHQERFA